MAHTTRAIVFSAALAALWATPADAAADPGLSAAAGASVPGGVSVSLHYRPISQLGVHAGPTYNGIALGAIVGAHYTPPIGRRVAPVVSASAGRLAEGDARPLASRVGAGAAAASPVLERVGYDFVAARAGAEFRLGRVRVRALAGVTYVRGELNGAEEALAGAGEEGGPALEFRSDVGLRALAPSARVGVEIPFPGR